MQAMLEVEHGGMSEVMIDLYALTGEERYRDVSRRFHHEAVLEPLRSGRDELPGRHANTQIPKITGAARSYEVTGIRPATAPVAEQFWHRVVDRHSWVIGGNSDQEHFFEPESAGEHLSPATAESCNTYNMLKLTEHLFMWEARVEYADYYERALYNHILASQEPEHGMYAYFMSLKPGFFRTYSTPHDSFWCCVGSGMENHTKYGRAIYFHDGDSLYVNLFIPSRLEWEETGLVLEQRTEYPRSAATEFTVVATPGSPLDIRLRVPNWAATGLDLRVNGERYVVDTPPGRYATVRRDWTAGDRLTVNLPMTLRTEELRGSPDRLAFLYGPVVLAGDLGPSSAARVFLTRRINGTTSRRRPQRYRSWSAIPGRSSIRCGRSPDWRSLSAPRACSMTSRSQSSCAPTPSCRTAATTSTGRCGRRRTERRVSPVPVSPVSDGCRPRKNHTILGFLRPTHATRRLAPAA